MSSMSLNRIKVFSICTDSAKPLLDKWFTPSIKDDWELCIKYLSEHKENGDYLSPQWYKVTKEKIFLLIDEIENNFGNIILWVDVDFQFFKKCMPEVMKAIKGRDIVFQFLNKKKKTANTGFMAIRCNESTLSFFKKISLIDFSSFEFADQDAANQVLADSPDLKWALFSRKVYAGYMGEPPMGIVAHHACGTRRPFYQGEKYFSSMDLKVEQLIYIKSIVSKPAVIRLGRILRIWFRQTLINIYSFLKNIARRSA